MRATGEEIATVMADLNTRLGLTGEELQTAAAAAAESGIDINDLASAMSIFGEDADTAAANMDKLFVISQTTGAELDTLTGEMQTYGPVLDNLGLDFDEAAAFLGNLHESGVDVSRIMPGLNAFMREAADEGVTDLRGALEGVIADMEGAETKADALNVATEAFGAEGAQRMITAVENGALSLDDLIGQLETSEGAIMENAEATTTNTEELAQMRQEISERLAGAWAKLPVEMQAVSGILGSMLAAAGPIMMGLPAMAGMVKAIGSQALFTKGKILLVNGVTAAWTALQWLLNAALSANPIGLVIAAIAAIIAIGVLLWKNWDTVKEKMGLLWDKFTEIFDKIKVKVREVFEAAVEFVQKNFDKIKEKAQALWMKINEVFGRIKNFMGDAFGAAWEKIKGHVNSILGGINAIIRAWNGLEFKMPSKTWNLPFGKSVTFGGGSVGTPNLPTIPLLGQGGIATSPQLAMVGDVPEAIIPLSQLRSVMAGAGGGRTIIVQGSIIDTEGLFQAVGEGSVMLDRRGRQRVFR